MNTRMLITTKAALIVGMAISGLGVQASAPSKKVVLPPDIAGPSADYPRENKIEFKRALAAGEEGRPIPTSGMLKSPFQSERIYSLKVVPGSPYIVELPMGETAESIWFDKQWWKAESTPGSNRIEIRALAADGIRGRKTNIHVETAPSNLLVSFKVEAVGEDQDPPSVVRIYMDGNDLEAKAMQQAQARALHETGMYKHQLDEDLKSNFEAWKAKAITQMRDDYRFDKGKFGLEKVVSDGHQTFIHMKTTEQPAIKLKNRDSVEETLNYDVKDGVFIVNHLLLDGEQFILVIGKETSTIRPR